MERAKWVSRAYLTTKAVKIPLEITTELVLCSLIILWGQSFQWPEASIGTAIACYLAINEILEWFLTRNKKKAT